MPVSYTFKNLAELGEYIRRQGAERRTRAPEMRSKPRAAVVMIEADVFDVCADIIAATKLEQ